MTHGPSRFLPSAGKSTGRSDLVEEFLRIHGTNELTDSGLSSPALLRENDPGYDFCNKAIDNLVGQGFQETCNYSLRSSEETSSWLPQLESEKIALANPLTSDHTHAFGRPSLARIGGSPRPQPEKPQRLARSI